MRVDARRNRERVLRAAEDLFLERGTNVSFEEIAKRAKVGIGTLYRRFPTRESLLAEMCDEGLVAIAQASRDRDDAGDLGSALRWYIEELVAASNKYRGLAALFGTVLQSNTPGCDAASAEAQRLLDLARAARIVRSDVSVNDLVYVITAAALAAAESKGSPPRGSHLVSLFLDGALERDSTNISRSQRKSSGPKRSGRRT